MLQRALLISGVAVVGLAAALLGAPPLLAATFPWPGIVSIEGKEALLIVTVGAVFFGAFSRSGRRMRGAVAAALPPALLTLGVFWTGLALPDDGARRAAIAVLAAALPLVLAVEAAVQAGRAPGAVLPLTGYLAALAIFSGILALRMRALATAPAIGMVVAVLAMLVWRRQGADTDSAAEPVDADDAAPVCPLGFSRKVVSALVVGTVAAEAAWALLYWPAPAPVAALALLVVFYVSAGLLGATERRSLSWPLATEYLVTGALALAAVIWAVLRVR